MSKVFFFFANLAWKKRFLQRRGEEHTATVLACVPLGSPDLLGIVYLGK
jgi:hypothetical protein